MYIWIIIAINSQCQKIQWLYFKHRILSCLLLLLFIICIGLTKVTRMIQNQHVMMQGDLGEEVTLWRLTSPFRWSKAKFKSSSAYFLLTCHLWKCRYRAHVYWNLSYPLSILKVIFLESNPLRFIETLISFIRDYVYICPPSNKTMCICFS